MVNRWLNFSHLRLAKTLTARQAACAFCKSNLSKIHLAGRRDSFRGTINYLGDIIVCAAINKKLGNIYRDEFCDLLKKLIENRKLCVKFLKLVSVASIKKPVMAGAKVIVIPDIKTI